ncbi:von Willebrand factor A domain-containing protein 5B2 [Bombina bombina]|uniref:von Willebrand factor A domain-containing protein 5B2 n=1 Tax=Bombina bombina TaxID=8345 RepID=UPI00235A81AE|nr:von Willebrand factor A domain-containing protein 5B2 [Bombina bombina]
MPGVYNVSSWVQLPLEASCVTANTNGYSLGIKAHLTYINPRNETVQAIFVYLLEEGEVITSFEAETSGRKVQAQIQNHSRIEECCSECPGESLPCCCPRGHLVLDSGTIRGSFMLSIGPVLPSANLNVVLRSNRELHTLRSGAVCVTINSTLTPLTPPLEGHNQQGEGLCDDRLCSCPTSCFGGVSGAGGNPWVLLSDSPPQTLHPTPSGSLTAAFTRPATNPYCYHFTFRLHVTGPCLLAGIESPSHALRADASPFARSASSVWISLAEEYECDKALEIILHPSEPYIPHLSLEKGAKSFSQYETQIKERRDFIRAIRKSSDPERQVSFVRRRFHKDLHLNPVLMLNFCPDLSAFSTLSSDLPTVTREIIFLVHLTGDTSYNVQDALLLAVRSLPARTILNVAVGASDRKALFPISRQCNNESLELACDYIRKGKLSGNVSNLLSVLHRILAIPVHRGYPRQLFLFTDSASSCPQKAIELMRRHAKTTRVFCFGLGSSKSHSLLEEIARVSRGTTEIVNEDERLQPKLIKSLKKALEPALSDITIDWYMPDTMEALLTPNEIAPIYPGDSLVGYCVLYHMASFRNKRVMGRGVKGGSLSSVFQSQDESQTPGVTDTSNLYPSTASEDVGHALQEISHEISIEFSAWSEEPEKSVDGAPLSDIRKRIVQSSYIKDQYVLTHCSVSTDPTNAPTHGSTSSESVGSRSNASEDSTPCQFDVVSQQGQRSVSQSERIHNSNKKAAASFKASVTQSSEELVRRKALIQATMSGRSFSSPHGELDMMRLHSALNKVSQSQDSEALVDSCNFMSPTQLDWDMLVDAPYLFTASPGIEVNSAASCGNSESGKQCRVVIHGYIGGRSLSWETTISLESLLCRSEEEKGDCTEDDGEYDLHHLAARSVIHDHEDTAWKECDIEHGYSRRFRLKAAQTSKSSSQVSSFTYHVPVDTSTQEVIPGHVIVHRGGRNKKSLGSSLGGWSQRDRRHSETMEEACVTSDNTENSPHSPVSLPSEYSWDKQRGKEGHILCAFGSHKSESSLGSRFSIGKRRIRTISGKLSPLKPPCLSGESEKCLELKIKDYLPLINMQSSEGFFTLNSSFSNVIQISLQRLLRASPYGCHHGSLSPVSEPSPPEQTHFLRQSAQTCKGGSHPQVPVLQDPSSLPLHASSCPEALCQQADSGRGSETDPCETSPCPSDAGTDPDLEGCTWATAVALAWLEHCCAGFFTEWELLAARAESWLKAQTLPDGLQVSTLKGAARHLFLLLRHWDENLNLNMLCYKPGNV